MSGHSKWSTIKRQKGITDKKKGLAFSKLTKAISAAARSGADPDSNFKLRLLIEKARAINMPKDNIARAIAKGSGQDSSGGLEEITYEGFGPKGVAVIVEAVTDNHNRTTTEIKSLFERAGGALAGPGGVAYQFKRMANILVEKTADPEAQLLAIMDLGVDDVDDLQEGIDIYCLPERLDDIKQKLIGAAFKIKEVEMIMRPLSVIPITERGEADKILNFVESLEDHEDAQSVFANFDIQIAEDGGTEH